MATLSNLLGGGSSAGAIDHRKEGLPLFGLFGTSGDQNDHMTYRIFDSGFKCVGSPWGAVCNSTTNYRFGILGDASFAYSKDDFGTSIGHQNLSSETYDDWQRYWKSIYQCDQYPHAQYYTSSRDGFYTFQSFHSYETQFEYDNGWTKLNHNLPEGCRPRRLFSNKRNAMREMNMGNNSCAAFDHYDYSSHMLSAQTYAIGTGYNEKNKMLVMVHSSGTGSDADKTVHIFESSKCLNHVTRIKDYFANLTSTEYFTDSWSSNNNRDMTVSVGNNKWVGFGHKYNSSMRYAAFNCKNGDSLGTTGSARIYVGWQDFAGSTTTSYGAEQGPQYYTKYNTTWDGTWGMIYSPYYYYGCGINGFCMSIENPRKFISINQTKSSRSNPYLAWGRTGFHGGWSDNTDGEQWQTYSWAFDPTDSDHTQNTVVYYGNTDNNDVIRDDNNSHSSSVTNKTGNYGLTAARTGLHGGSETTCYPAIMQVDWWGAYGNNDSTYGGIGHSGTEE
jgi:hypothetical protein